MADASIGAGGVTRRFAQTDRIATSNPTTGETDTWIDEPSLQSKYVGANGLYLASDDDAVGYSDVSVNVPGACKYDGIVQIPAGLTMAGLTMGEIMGIPDTDLLGSLVMGVDADGHLTSEHIRGDGDAYMAIQGSGSGSGTLIMRMLFKKSNGKYVSTINNVYGYVEAGITIDAEFHEVKRQQVYYDPNVGRARLASGEAPEAGVLYESTDTVCTRYKATYDKTASELAAIPVKRSTTLMSTIYADQNDIQTLMDFGREFCEKTIVKSFTCARRIYEDGSFTPSTWQVYKLYYGPLIVPYRGYKIAFNGSTGTYDTTYPGFIYKYEPRKTTAPTMDYGVSFSYPTAKDLWRSILMCSSVSSDYPLIPTGGATITVDGTTYEVFAAPSYANTSNVYYGGPFGFNTSARYTSGRIEPPPATSEVDIMYGNAEIHDYGTDTFFAPGDFVLKADFDPVLAAQLESRASILAESRSLNVEPDQIYDMFLSVFSGLEDGEEKARVAAETMLAYIESE